MVERKTYHHGDLRQALIQAALELTTEKDLASLSLREVARRVGVSHTSSYRHFTDKDALLAAVAQAGFQTLHQVLETAMQQAPSEPLKQLQATGVAYIDFALEHSAHYHLMFGAYGANSAQQHPELEQTATQAFMVIVRIVETGQQAGVIRQGDPIQLAQAAWSMSHGFVMLLMDGQIPKAPDQSVASLSNFITQVLIEGFLPVSPPRN